MAELTPHEKEILRTLRQKGTQTKSRLAFRMAVPPAQIEQALGKLDAAGLIRRKPLKSDKTTESIAITGDGVTTLHDAD